MKKRLRGNFDDSRRQNTHDLLLALNLGVCMVDDFLSCLERTIRLDALKEPLV
jgi:hypothetical protein